MSLASTPKAPRRDDPDGIARRGAIGPAPADMSETGAHHSLDPSPWIVRFSPLVRAGARVLDLACGHGRHARYFATRGARVVAVDRDPEALATLAEVRGVETRALDLETGPWPLEGETFDAVVVANYLHRPLFAPLLASLAPDVVLLYETFAVGNEAFGRPSNPDFLLREGELLERISGRLRVVAFEQGEVDSPWPAVVQRICAVGPARRWPWPLAAALHR